VKLVALPVGATDKRYVPVPPVPVPRPTMVVPVTTPVPEMMLPMPRLDVVRAVTVKVVPLVDPVMLLTGEEIMVVPLARPPPEMVCPTPSVFVAAAVTVRVVPLTDPVMALPKVTPAPVLLMTRFLNSALLATVRSPFM
jgi:hypothetical protein